MKRKFVNFKFLSKMSKILFLFFIIFVFLFFYCCLYSVEKDKLASDDLDSILVRVKNGQNSFIYPDKDLLKLLEAIILERKSQYKAAYEIYSNLIDSPYIIYAKNRKEIIEKYYLTPIIQVPKIQKPAEETEIAKFERLNIELLNQGNIKKFFNIFYSIIFIQNKLSTEVIKNKFKDLSKTIDLIKENALIQQNLSILINLTDEILLDKNLPYMTKSKIYYYQFFYYLFLKIKTSEIEEKILSSLYLSFNNGGLYYYQILSYCIINSLAFNELLKQTLNISKLNFNKIDLSDYFEFSENSSQDFLSIKKGKNELKKNLNKTFSSSILKKIEYSTKILKRHLFLANYFIENDLFLEFSRAIFYLRDLTQNYKIYNSLLVDFYNFTDEYEKAIYYKWDSILIEFFPMSLNKKLPIINLLPIFPLWYIEIIKENIEKFKNNFDPQLEENSIFKDPYFYLAIINAESSFSNKIISSANAVGLMQLLPSTAAWVRKTGVLEAKQKLTDPTYNVESGFYYILYLYKYFDGNLISVLGAYNGGHNAFAKKRSNLIHPLLVSELYPVSETSIYIKKIIRNYLFYKLIYDKKSWEYTIIELIIQSPDNY